MPGWLVEVLKALAAGVLTAAVLALYRRCRASSLRKSVRSGASVTFNAWLRGKTPPFPRRWQDGQVTVGLGAPVWRRRLSLVRRPVELPMSAVVDQIRPVSGFREILGVSANVMIIVARTDTVTFELGVYARELASVLQVLESRSGGGWRVPSTVEVTVVKGPEVTTYNVKRW